LAWQAAHLLQERDGKRAALLEEQEERHAVHDAPRAFPNLDHRHVPQADELAVCVDQPESTAEPRVDAEIVQGSTSSFLVRSAKAK
jgi:hypothetical protein